MRPLALLPLLFVLLLAGCVDSEPPPDRRVISTDAAQAAIGPYSQAVQVGNTLYCSGQIGIDPETDSLVTGGIEAETRRALDNLRAVLQAADFSMNDVVRTQVFLADLDDYAAMNEVYGTYFEDAPPAHASKSWSRPGRRALPIDLGLTQLIGENALHERESVFRPPRFPKPRRSTEASA